MSPRGGDAVLLHGAASRVSLFRCLPGELYFGCDLTQGGHVELVSLILPYIMKYILTMY